MKKPAKKSQKTQKSQKKQGKKLVLKQTVLSPADLKHVTAGGFPVTPWD